MNKTINTYTKDIEETCWLKITDRSVSNLWSDICIFTTTNSEEFDIILLNNVYDGIIKVLKNDT